VSLGDLAAGNIRRQANRRSVISTHWSRSDSCCPTPRLHPGHLFHRSFLPLTACFLEDYLGLGDGPDFCFRPHRLHAVHRSGVLLQMSHVAWSVCLYVTVCLSVCWAHGSTVQKRLNRSRCAPKEQCVWWVSISDESIRRRQGWQDGDATFCQISLDECWFVFYCLSRFCLSVSPGSVNNCRLIFFDIWK